MLPAPTARRGHVVRVWLAAVWAAFGTGVRERWVVQSVLRLMLGDRAAAPPLPRGVVVSLADADGDLACCLESFEGRRDCVGLPLAARGPEDAPRDRVAGGTSLFPLAAKL